MTPNPITIASCGLSTCHRAGAHTLAAHGDATIVQELERLRRAILDAPVSREADAAARDRLAAQIVEW